MTPADLTFVASIASHIVTLLVRPATEDRPDPIKVERLEQEDGGYLWAVRCRGNVLSRSGRWAWEPSPSNRRKDHACRYRFGSLEAAWKAAIKAQAVADREWAEHCARIDAKRAVTP